MAKSPLGIQSIDVGFRLLKALEIAGAAMPLKTLAAAAGMTSAKAYPYLVSFVRTGVARQDPATGHYGLGPFATQLGLSALGQNNVIDLAREEFLALRETTGCGVYVSVWAARGPTIMSALDGIYQGSLAIRIGHVLPMLTSATGRIFLAYLNPKETAHVVDAEWHSQMKASPRRHPRALDSIVAQVRRQGYAELSRFIRIREGFVISLRQVNPPFGAFSCPLFDPLQRLVGALSMLVPVEIQSDRGRGEFLPSLMAASRRIAEKLGSKPPSATRNADKSPGLSRRRRSPRTRA
jgi:DNA-binding IclR family transcriptional regulator